MADSLNFDEIEAEAKAKVETIEKEKAENGGEAKPERFKNWTKGPIIAGAIIAVVVIGAMLIFAYVV